jgi:hypothetical protein
MRIGVMIYGRLNKCIEHYESIINCLGKNNEKDFVYHQTIHQNHY